MTTGTTTGTACKPELLLQRGVALFTACLMLSVWPLWTKHSREFVQIPWLSMLCQIPTWVDQGLLVGVTGAIALLLFGRGHGRSQRIGCWLFVISLGGLVSLDQHRFQPWVCQFLIYGVLAAIANGPQILKSWRVIVLSIYFWSAISKLDVAFLTSHGQLLLSGMLQPLGVDFTFWPEQTRQSMALLFPAGELLVVLLLLSRRLRIAGLACSVVMHLILIWTLGLGLHHEWSVLIWNLFFIVQNLIVFGPWAFLPCPATPALMPLRFWTPQRALTSATAVAVMYPALELMGYCDHWPAWAVYSSRPAIVKVYLEETAAENLPARLKPFLGTPQPLDDRLPFSLDAWSFQTCHCPVYPQLRYRLALLQGLLAGHVPESAVTVEIFKTPNRWTGSRDRLRLHNMKAVTAYCSQFLWNTNRRDEP